MATGMVISFRRKGEKMNDLFLKLHLTVQSILVRNEGQSMAEYVMAVALIALGCVAGESAVAHSVNQTFISMATTITNGIAQ